MKEYDWPTLDEQLIKTIEAGKTTASEIEKEFGVPDIIILKSELKIPDDSVLGLLMQTAFYRVPTEEGMSSHAHPNYQNEIKKWKNYVDAYVDQQRRNATLEKHKVFIYLDLFQFVEGYDHAHGMRTPRYRVKKNELTIFINPETDIVKNCKFEKEWDFNDLKRVDKIWIRRQTYRPRIPDWMVSVPKSPIEKQE